jgi:hypothetical protein
LEELFDRVRVAGVLSRLDEIHDYTEERWQRYLAMLRDGLVHYLLIAEAAPWSPAGMPQYVLDPASRSRTLMRALRGAFLSPSVSRQLDAGQALAEFARQGLLVVDSIPFPMKYSSQKRQSPKYNGLVRLTARSYLLKKLCDTKLSWSPNLSVAFSVKRNAEAVMKGLDHQLKLGDVRLDLGPEQIAVNGAGYPDAGKLRVSFDLPANSNG